MSADAASGRRCAKADVAQLAERVLGKDEVTSSILVIGSIRLAFQFASGEPNGSLMASHGTSNALSERSESKGFSGGERLRIETRRCAKTKR